MTEIYIDFSKVWPQRSPPSMNDERIETVYCDYCDTWYVPDDPWHESCMAMQEEQREVEREFFPVS